jgi:hypothetical protein
MARKILGILRLHGFASVRVAGRGSCWLEGGEGMTPAKKARRLEDLAEHPFSHNMSDSDVEIAAEAAAHFRTLIPDANGLLPCPMCGPHGKPTITGTFQGDFNVICKTCSLRTVYHMEKADAIAAWNRRGGVAYE